jgi:TRAP-type mannitol/chloroaromatic compound transport system substrate-binding protein
MGDNQMTRSRSKRSVLSGALATTTATTLAAVLSVGVWSNAQAEERVVWKMHSAFPSKLKILGSGAERVVDSVEKLSKGTFRLKFYEPNALLPAFDYLDGVSSGAVPAAWSIASLHAGRIQALTFYGAVPFGPGPGEFLAWLKYGGGQELHDEFYERLGLKVLLCGIFPPESSGWFKKEVMSIDEMRGMKFRIGGFGAKVLQKFGVSTQLIAGGDIYPALERGTIDATEFSMPVIDEGFGFYQIAKHYYFPGWHQQATLQHLDINLKAWEGLSQWHKDILEAACTANVASAIAEGEGLQYAAIRRMQAKGVQVHRWPQESLDKLEAAWNEVVEEAAAGDADVKRVWDSYRTFREQYAVWGNLGYIK